MYPAPLDDRRSVFLQCPGDAFLLDSIKVGDAPLEVVERESGGLSVSLDFMFSIPGAFLARVHWRPFLGERCLVPFPGSPGPRARTQTVGRQAPAHPSPRDVQSAAVASVRVGVPVRGGEGPVTFAAAVARRCLGGRRLLVYEDQRKSGWLRVVVARVLTGRPRRARVAPRRSRAAAATRTGARGAGRRAGLRAVRRRCAARSSWKNSPTSRSDSSLLLSAPGAFPLVVIVTPTECRPPARGAVRGDLRGSNVARGAAEPPLGQSRSRAQWWDGTNGGTASPFRQPFRWTLLVEPRLSSGGIGSKRGWLGPAEPWPTSATLTPTRV
jgi:hypothetical protein